jgi:hypothetical protein
MKHRLTPALWLLAAAAMACRDSEQRPAEAQAAPDKNGYNACRLLKPPEIEALAEKQVLMANVIEAAPERSVCHWEDAAGIVFKITVYWTGGKQGWETWRAAQGMGGAALSEAEGVHPDSIIKQGLVPGLGDAAYFSELLPSLLLKHDTLVEMEMSLVPHPEKKFRKLATTLLSRM